MGGVCTKVSDKVCQAADPGHHGCGFSCACMSCSKGDGCDCSCRWLVVGGMVLTALSFWVAFLSYKEKRRWLFTWSSIYFCASALLTTLTHVKGPDAHDWYGCSVPLSFWILFIFVSTLGYYTTDYMQRGLDNSERPERYVFDPKAGEYVSQSLNNYRVV